MTMNPTHLIEALSRSLMPTLPHRQNGFGAVRPLITVPGVREWLPLLFNYAQDGALLVGSGEYQQRYTITRVAANPDALVVEWLERQGDRSDTKAHYHVYESEQQRRLCTGEPVEFDGYTVRFDGGVRLPFVQWVGEGRIALMVENLTIAVRKRGVLGWFMNPLYQAEVRGIVIDYEGADVQLAGLIGNALEPRLVWGEA